MFASAASPTPSSRLRPHVFALVGVSLLLNACATRDSIMLPAIGGWESRQQVLVGQDNWEFKARIAVRTSDDGFNGKLRWTQDANSFLATVSGPLGIGTVRIAGDGQTVTMTDKDGGRQELANVENELQYRYGWTIPVTSLRYWAMGIPEPGIEAETEFDAEGQLVKLVQRDWDVSITRYRPGGGQMMPNRLTASNADTRVRIVIDNWLFFD